MNRLIRSLRAGFGTLTANAGGAFAWLGEKAPAGSLSIVPTYLAHLLYLISQRFRDLATEGYGGNAAVFACVQLLKNSVAEPPLIAYTRREDGAPGDPLAWDHPLRQRIRTPNPLMTEAEMWEMVELHCDIAGRSCWWKERDAVGRMIALWPLRPDRVGPIYAGVEDFARGERVIVGWSYLVPGTVHYLAIPRRDVVSYNFPDPMGESGGIVEGWGPLQALLREVSADNEATNYVGNLLHNDARPGIVLEVQGTITSPDDAKVIKASFVDEFGGRRRGSPAVVDRGTNVTSVGFDMHQLEFPALRRIAESRICAAFGVPAILVGLLVGLEAGIRATIAEQREFFAETTLAGRWRRYSDQFTLDVASEYGAEIVCAFDTTKVKALAAQSSVKVKELTDAAALGAVTKNELRDALGLPPRDDGDVYILGAAPGAGMETFATAAPEYGVDLPDDDVPAPAKRKPAVVPAVTDGSDTGLTSAA